MPDNLPGDTNFDGVITTTIVINTPDDRSLEGSPYELYTPTASQTLIRPYLTGVVGRGNVIRLDDLPAARYRLVVLPANGESVEVTIELSSADSNLVLDVETMPRLNSPVPVIPPSPGNGVVREIVTDGTSGALSVAGPSDISATITGLPSTGEGNGRRDDGVLWMVIFGLLLATVVAATSQPRTEEQD